MRHREAPRASGAGQQGCPSHTPQHGSFLRRPGTGALIALIVFYKLGDALAQGMLRPFLTDAGLTLADLGWMLGGVGFVAGLVGALAGGGLIRSLGRRRSLVYFGVLQSMSIVGYAWLSAMGSAPRGAVAAAVAFEHFAGGMATAALFTVMMDACRPGSGASDYTAQASAVVTTSGLATLVSGFVADAVGYTSLFAAAAVLGVVGVVAATFYGRPGLGRSHAFKGVTA